MRSFAAAMFTCAYLMVTGAAYAELTEVDLFLNGDGLVTRDDATGLDWLDLTATTNLSFNDILAGADGWVGAGWRHRRHRRGEPFVLDVLISRIGGGADSTWYQAFSLADSRTRMV